MKRSFKKLLAYAATLVFCVQGGAVFASAEGTASAVTGLTVAEYPDVMVYHIGDELITDGIRVEASYEDGTTADVTADCTFDYDFSQSGNSHVAITYAEKDTGLQVMVVPEKYSMYIVDPAGGTRDALGRYIFKEGETLEDREYYLEFTDDSTQAYLGVVDISPRMISGFTPELGEKTLTLSVPIGNREEVHTITFPARVLSEEDYQRYHQVREDLHYYEHAMSEAIYNSQTNEYGPLLPVEVYNFNGNVTAENLEGLMLFRYFLSTWDDPIGGTIGNIPASKVKSWLEEALMITNFDVEDSPLYNAEDDTIFWDSFDGGWGACGDPWYQMNWTWDDNDNWIVEYATEGISPLHGHNVQIVYTADNRIVSITMMPEKLELVSAPSKTAYEQGENLDLTGGQIKAIYDEERSETLPITADMISGYDSAKAGKQTVTVTYGGQSVSFDVTVAAAENTPPVVIDDKETGIRLEASEGVVPSDTMLKAEKVTDGENFTIVDKALTDTADKWVAYDIRLLSDNAEIQPNGKVKIAIPRPTELNADKLALFHVAEDGKLTQIPYTLDEATDRIVFETDHFSLYAVAEKNEADSGSSNPPTGYSGRGFLPLAVLLMAGTAVLLLRKRQTAK